ncbi:MazG nucleotide pyrophosphohydrolase domain protein [compost metagenome]
MTGKRSRFGWLACLVFGGLCGAGLAYVISMIAGKPLRPDAIVGMVGGCSLAFVFVHWVAGLDDKESSPPGVLSSAPVAPEQVTDIDEYGQFTVDAWMGGPDSDEDEQQLSIMALGLSGETGEVMEVLKKRLRDGEFDRAKLKKELGDVSYYWARLCRAYGFQPSEVLGENVTKIRSRAARGVMSGSGDDR